MKRPQLKEIPVKQQTITTFGGYNHQYKIGDNEWYDMQNMAPDDTPVLSPRRPRGYLREITGLQGLYARDTLYYIHDGYLYKGGKRIDLSTAGIDRFGGGERTLISMGAYLVIFPDKIRYNTSTGTASSLPVPGKSILTPAGWKTGTPTPFIPNGRTRPRQIPPVACTGWIRQITY